MIRIASNEDIPLLAEIHLSSLSDDFLPRLGKEFLIEYFYPSVLFSKVATTYVDVEEDRINSFVIFTTNSSALTKQMMKMSMKKIFLLFKGLLKDWTLVKEIFALAIGYKIELQEVVDLAAIPELYLIATTPGKQSKGIGSSLVKAGLKDLSEKGKAQCLVKTASTRAKDFYEKLGFVEIGYEYRLNRKLFLLLISE